MRFAVVGAAVVVATQDANERQLRHRCDDCITVCMRYEVLGMSLRERVVLLCWLCATHAYANVRSI
jgi:hypothetical protein